MEIEKDRLISYIDETLNAMNLAMPVGSMQCMHCGLAIRYPIIARQRDIELFERMIKTASNVMDDYGITGNLLAEIRARCLVAIAIKQDNDIQPK